MSAGSFILAILTGMLLGYFTMKILHAFGVDWFVPYPTPQSLADTAAIMEAWSFDNIPTTSEGAFEKRRTNKAFETYRAEVLRKLRAESRDFHKFLKEGETVAEAAAFNEWKAKNNWREEKSPT